MNPPEYNANSLFSSIRHIIINNIGPLILAQIVTFGINFIQLIYLARVLAPDNCGLMNFALTIQFFALILTNLGISYMGTRELVTRRLYDPLLFWNITALRFLLFLGFVGIVLLWSFFCEPDYSRILIYLIFLSCVIPAILTPDWVFIGLEMMKINSLIKIVITISGFVFVLIFIKGPGDLLLVPITYLTAAITGLVIGLICLKKITGQWNIRINPSFWMGYIRDSIRLGITSSLIITVASVDVFIIGMFLTTADVGYYSAASKLILAVHTLIILITTGIFPSVIRTMEQSPQFIRAISPYFITLILVLEIPCFLFISINSDLIIDVLYGAKYAQTVPVFAILVWSIIPYTLCNLYTIILNASYRESIIVRVLAIQMILLVPIMIAGTTLFGITGAAEAIVFIEILITLLYVFLFRGEILFPAKNVLLLVLFTMIAVLLYLFLVQILHGTPYGLVTRIVPILIMTAGILILRILPVQELLRLVVNR